jgi:hypothetical protein
MFRTSWEDMTGAKHLAQTDRLAHWYIHGLGLLPCRDMIWIEWNQSFRQDVSMNRSCWHSVLDDYWYIKLSKWLNSTMMYLCPGYWGDSQRESEDIPMFCTQVTDHWTEEVSSSQLDGPVKVFFMSFKKESKYRAVQQIEMIWRLSIPIHSIFISLSSSPSFSYSISPDLSGILKLVVPYPIQPSLSLVVSRSQTVFQTSRLVGWRCWSGSPQTLMLFRWFIYPVETGGSRLRRKCRTWRQAMSWLHFSDLMLHLREATQSWTWMIMIIMRDSTKSSWMYCQWLSK